MTSGRLVVSYEIKTMTFEVYKIFVLILKNLVDQDIINRNIRISKQESRNKNQVITCYSNKSFIRKQKISCKKHWETGIK